MSTYLTLKGEFTFPHKKAYDAAVELLQEGGWMDQEGFLLEETGGRRSDEPDATPSSLTINFPYGLYRNIGSRIDSFKAGTTGLLVWTSTDGMFQGGVIRDGVEKSFDLEKWAKEHGLAVMPDPATDFDAFVEWQSEVEEEFLAANETPPVCGGLQAITIPPPLKSVNASDWTLLASRQYWRDSNLQLFLAFMRIHASRTSPTPCRQ